MSAYSSEYLNNNTLIGFTEKRGNAWHRDLSLVTSPLDNHYPGAIPVQDIQARMFNWTAEERAVYVDGGDEGLIQDTSRKALVRSDNHAILGIHAKGYKRHDYSEWLLHNLSELVGGGAEFANVVMLKHGAVAVVQIEMPDNVTTIGGVVLRPFILAGTSFDGSLASFFKPGVTNVVCDNTFGAFMSEDTAVYRQKHTANSKFNITDARAALSLLVETGETAVKEIERLLSVDVSDADWSKFVQAHAPIDDKTSKRSTTMAETKRQALTGLWRTDMRVAPWSGTAWGVMQAVNTYNEHMAIVRNVDRYERKFARAVTDDIQTADRATLATLSTVLGRDLATV